MTVVPVEGSVDVPRHVRILIVVIACVLGFALGGSVRSGVLRLESMSTGSPAGSATLSPVSLDTDDRPLSVQPASAGVVPPTTAHRIRPAEVGETGPIRPVPAVVPPAETRPNRTAVPVPRASGEGRRIVYQKSTMHLWVIDADGTVLRDYPVTGGPTAPGRGPTGCTRSRPRRCRRRRHG